MARLRTNSAFQRLTAAYASNEMGVTIAYILIPLVILDLTGSATNAGLVTALATTASTVAGIMSGAIADRSNPSFLLRLSFGLEFLLWGLLGLLLWQGTANVAIIAVLAIITSAVGAIDGPSEFVILKRIIPTNQLGEATAITEARGSTMELIGTPIGGVLFTLGGHIAFGIQSLLHLVAIFLVPPVRDARTTDSEDQPEKPHFLQDVKTGFTLVMGNMGLRHLTYVASIANLGMVPVSFILLAELETLGTPPPLIGVILACFGGGVLLGAPLTAKLTNRFPLATLLQAALAIYTLTSLALLVTIHHFWVSAIIVLISGVALPAMNSAITSYTLAVSDETHVGKVFTASGVPGMILAPLGLWLAGVTLDHYGFTITMGWAAGALTIALAMSLASPALRAMPKLTDLADPADSTEADETETP